MKVVQDKCSKCNKPSKELYSKWQHEYSRHVDEYCRKCYKKVYKHDFYTDRTKEILERSENGEAKLEGKRVKVKTVRR